MAPDDEMEEYESLLSKKLLESYKNDLEGLEDKQTNTSESSNYLWTVFFDYDASFVWVMSLTSFGIGFRRILELGLYYVLRDKLGL